MSIRNSNPTQLPKEDISDYVAHLQVHMSLQSRNLLPQDEEEQTMSPVEDLLYQTQVNMEKSASRELA